MAGYIEHPSDDVNRWRDQHDEAPDFEIIDDGLMQPVGFVWFGKPRYRVAARSRVLTKTNDKT